jgi:Peptidase family S64
MEIFDQISIVNPDLFMTTTKLRSAVFNRIQDCVDASLGRSFSLKTLQYVLRIALASNVYQKGSDEPENYLLKTRFVKNNISRLLKHLDFYNHLPPDEAGILRNSYKMSLMPYNPTSTLEKATLKAESTFVVKMVAKSAPNFVVYSSRWGINEKISLPVMNVITPSPNTDLESKLREYYGPYSYDTLPIRFGTGSVEAAGRIWYYPQTPISSSISPDEPYIDPPTAGTLGFYVSDKNDLTVRYFVTAGHVARADTSYTNITLFAPASKPFTEAKRSLEIALTRSIKRDDQTQAKKYRDRLDQLLNLDRTIGHIVYATTQTSTAPHYYKEDVALVRARSERATDNSLRRISLYSQNVEFNNEFTIPSEIVPPAVGTPVVKVGIRTGYTEGVIVSTSYVRWKHDTTETVPNDDPEYDLLPTSAAHSVLGTDEQRFADSGDSGSLLVTFDKDDGNAVDKVMAVGMIYAILTEDPPSPSLTFFYPMQDLLAKLNKETGLDLVLDETVSVGDPWPFVEHGAGRSMYDLK